MDLSHDLQKRLIERFGRVVDLKENPAVLAAIADEVRQALHPGGASSAVPFGVSWMDSWVAHWIYDANVKSAAATNRELATALRGLVDVRFSERLTELQLFVRERLGGAAGAPDGGPPEPGTPPVGPVSFEPPDGGPPEPGTPPVGPVSFEPPDGGPPEPGVPDPPPDPGPDQGFLGENPWILYWFVSLKAPVLLNVIDAHINHRLDELAARMKGRAGA